MNNTTLYIFAGVFGFLALLCICFGCCGFGGYYITKNANAKKAKEKAATARKKKHAKVSPSKMMTREMAMEMGSITHDHIQPPLPPYIQQQQSQLIQQQPQYVLPPAPPHQFHVPLQSIMSGNMSLAEAANYQSQVQQSQPQPQIVVIRDGEESDEQADLSSDRIAHIQRQRSELSMQRQRASDNRQLTSELKCQSSEKSITSDLISSLTRCNDLLEEEAKRKDLTKKVRFDEQKSPQELPSEFPVQSLRRERVDGVRSCRQLSSAVPVQSLRQERERRGKMERVGRDVPSDISSDIFTQDSPDQNEASQFCVTKIFTTEESTKVFKNSPRQSIHKNLSSSMPNLYSNSIYSMPNTRYTSATWPNLSPINKTSRSNIEPYLDDDESEDELSISTQSSSMSAKSSSSVSIGTLGNGQIIGICAAHGPLKLILDSPDNGWPMVHSIKEGSSVASEIKIGDRVLTMNNMDILQMSAVEVQRMMNRVTMGDVSMTIFRDASLTILN